MKILNTDYKAIAEVIKAQRCCAGMGPDMCVDCSDNGVGPATVDDLARALADHFAKEQPLFSRADFLKWAGVP